MAKQEQSVADTGLRERVAALDWASLAEALDADGFARIPRLLRAAECASVARLFAADARFRSSVDMERHRYGRGRYRYFARPLPGLVEGLRRAFYPHLAPIANAWQARLGREGRFEPSLRGFLRRCHAAEQRRPTPLLLRYEADGFNNLHRDLYGEIAFPFQVVVCLSRPGRDYEGGEFLLVENRARQQSRGEAIALAQGEALVFPTRERPVPSPRGTARAELRHGLSRVRAGERLALGIIFHDAR